jgi:hypothetical protein
MRDFETTRDHEPRVVFFLRRSRVWGAATAPDGGPLDRRGNHHEGAVDIHCRPRAPWPYPFERMVAYADG